MRKTFILLYLGFILNLNTTLQKKFELHVIYGLDLDC